MRAAAFALALALGCGGEEGAARDAAAEADGRALLAILDDGAYAEALVAAEEAVADDLPVRAAERLETITLPAARRQLERAEAFAPESPRGRGIGGRAAHALRARVAAVEAYREALARGLVEDLALVDALRGLRRADAAVRDAYEAAADLAGPQAAPAVPADAPPGATLRPPSAAPSAMRTPR